MPVGDIIDWITGDKSNSLSAKNAIKLCDSTAKDFINAIDEFESEENYESIKTKKSYNFTALLICASIVYLKTHYKDGIKYHPETNQLQYNSIFYEEFVKLIIERAEGLNYDYMQNDLHMGFDGEDYFPELTPSFLCMEYLCRSAESIVNMQNDVNSIRNLAYNYSEMPGRLKFEYMSNSNIEIDDEIISILEYNIIEAEKKILPTLLLRKIYH